MTQMVRVCKYGCNNQLGQFDTKENKFLEIDGKTIHTRERCESLKNKPTTTITQQNREAKIAHVISMIQTVIGELEELKK